MPAEQPPIHDTPAPSAAVQAPADPAYEPIEEDEWLDEPAELPRRPRRRLLTPIPLALLAVLLIACGFIAGVLVEKGQSSSSSGSSSGAAASLAARFAALRGGASGAGGGAARGGSSTGAAAGGGGFGGSGGAGASGATAGQVAYISGSTLYVTTAEGNTIKVLASAGSSVTKTVKASVKGIHPGETVTVTGATGSNGAVSAESIRVGAGGGGLAALFGGSGSAASSRSGSSGSGGTGGGGQALFGNGG